jgi:hypothetical protein
VRELTTPGGSISLLPSKPLEREKGKQRSIENGHVKALSLGANAEAGLEGSPPLIRQRRSVTMEDISRERTRRKAEEE